jgi:hypothetical protein
MTDAGPQTFEQRLTALETEISETAATAIWGFIAGATIMSGGFNFKTVPVRQAFYGGTVGAVVSSLGAYYYVRHKVRSGSENRAR